MKDEVCEEMEVEDEVSTRTDPSRNPIVFENEIQSDTQLVKLSSVTSLYIVYITFICGCGTLLWK